MITKIMKRLAIFTMALMCLSSCENDDNMTSYASVSTETKSVEPKLQMYIQDEVRKFNEVHFYSVFYKEEAIKDFDDIVKNVEDEANSGKYTIYVYSSMTLELKWGIKDVKKVKLNLIPNVSDKIVLSAEIEQDNISGDPTRFTELYTKKLTDAGFVVKADNEYTYYREFDKLEDAEKDLKRLENDSILSYSNAFRYFASMEKMDYLGKIEIEYNLINGKNEELSGYSSSSVSTSFYEFDKLHTPNKFSAEGYVLVTKIK